MQFYKNVIQDINSLIEYESNSRTHSKSQIKQICKSIEKYGFTNPVLIDEKNGIIAGHGRVMACRELEIKQVPCVVITGLSDNDKAALVIADNKLAENAGWNEDALIAELNFLQGDDYDLSLTGFSQDEIDELLKEPETATEPDIVFSEELGEANNYIVLVFDTEIDWLSAQSHFDLDSKYSKRANGKPWSKGVGRVLNGAEYLNKVNKI